uniref:Uncharacterized protein n=1 Tax=Oryza meridionalis TaxID=40149 RepID=A0A0E0F4X4_9ORYZ
MAELLDVCWLEITGKLQLSLLSPATTYAAYLVYSFCNIGMPTPMAMVTIVSGGGMSRLLAPGDDDGAQDLPATHGGGGDDDAPAGAGGAAAASSSSAAAATGRPAAVVGETHRWSRRNRGSGEESGPAAVAGLQRRDAPPAPAQADRDVEMGLPDGESSASRPVTKPQPCS